MKDKDKLFESVIGVFAFIGIIATFIFITNLFTNNNEDTDNICGAYLGEIDELKSEITDLEEDIDGLEYQKYELEQKVENWKEEYNALEESRGCNTGGTAILTDGSNKKGE